MELTYGGSGCTAWRTVEPVPGVPRKLLAQKSRTRSARRLTDRTVLSMDATFDEIGLADAISVIRDDILSATQRNTESPLRFELGEIQMEFTVELRRDTRAKGGVKAWVADASAERGHGATHTQRVAFTLKPRDALTGRGWEISNDQEGRTGRFGENGVASNE